MYKVHLILRVFLEFRVEHFDSRDISTSFKSQEQKPDCANLKITFTKFSMLQIDLSRSCIFLTALAYDWVSKQLGSDS